MLKPLNVKTQLVFYEKALKDYKNNLWKFHRDHKVSSGFCYYFMGYNLHVKTHLPILFNLGNGYKYRKNSYFWFRPGKLRPRIKLLEKAIEICKK